VLADWLALGFIAIAPSAVATTSGAPTDGGSPTLSGPRSTSGKHDAGVQSPKTQTAPDVKALVDRMQAFYEKTNDFTARFTQEYAYKTFNRRQTSSGKVTFLKPGMMRWDYESPTPKTFILAGEKVYAYDPEAMTLTIANLKTNELSASVTFLWGKGRLEKEFSIARAACSNCAGVLLELTPLQPDPRFQKVRLEVDPKSAQVLKSVVVDPDGSENTIAFSELKTNQGVSKDLFKVKPSEGTQVIDLTKTGGK
jgi:outer membrane lipoprotein carrier protein